MMKLNNNNRYYCCFFQIPFFLAISARSIALAVVLLHAIFTLIVYHPVVGFNSVGKPCSYNATCLGENENCQNLTWESPTGVCWCLPLYTIGEETDSADLAYDYSDKGGYLGNTRPCAPMVFLKVDDTCYGSYNERVSAVNAYCNEITGYVECLTGYIQESPNHCVPPDLEPSRQEGAYCLNDRECAKPMICDLNTTECKCQHSFLTYVPEKGICRRKRFGDSCTSHNDCMFAWVARSFSPAFCINGKCRGRNRNRWKPTTVTLTKVSTSPATPAPAKHKVQKPKQLLIEDTDFGDDVFLIIDDKGPPTSSPSPSRKPNSTTTPLPSATIVSTKTSVYTKVLEILDPCWDDVDYTGVLLRNPNCKKSSQTSPPTTLPSRNGSSINYNTTLTTKAVFSNISSTEITNVTTRLSPRTSPVTTTLKVLDPCWEDVDYGGVLARNPNCTKSTSRSTFPTSPSNLSNVDYGDILFTRSFPVTTGKTSNFSSTEALNATILNGTGTVTSPKTTANTTTMKIVDPCWENVDYGGILPRNPNCTKPTTSSTFPTLPSNLSNVDYGDILFTRSPVITTGQARNVSSTEAFNTTSLNSTTTQTSSPTTMKIIDPCWENVDYGGILPANPNCTRITSPPSSTPIKTTAQPRNSSSITEIFNHTTSTSPNPVTIRTTAVTTTMKIVDPCWENVDYSNVLPPNPDCRRSSTTTPRITTTVPTNWSNVLSTKAPSTILPTNITALESSTISPENATQTQTSSINVTSSTGATTKPPTMPQVQIVTTLLPSTNGTMPTVAPQVSNASTSVHVTEEPTTKAAPKTTLSPHSTTAQLVTTTIKQPSPSTQISVTSLPTSSSTVSNATMQITENMTSLSSVVTTTVIAETTLVPSSSTTVFPVTALSTTVQGAASTETFHQSNTTSETIIPLLNTCSPKNMSTCSENEECTPNLCNIWQCRCIPQFKRDGFGICSEVKRLQIGDSCNEKASNEQLPPHTTCKHSQVACNAFHRQSSGRCFRFRHGGHGSTCFSPNHCVTEGDGNQRLWCDFARSTCRCYDVSTPKWNRLLDRCEKREFGDECLTDEDCVTFGDITTGGYTYGGGVCSKSNGTQIGQCACRQNYIGTRFTYTDPEDEEQVQPRTKTICIHKSSGVNVGFYQPCTLDPIYYGDNPFGRIRVCRPDAVCVRCSNEPAIKSILQIQGFCRPIDNRGLQITY